MSKTVPFPSLRIFSLSVARPQHPHQDLPLSDLGIGDHVPGRSLLAKMVHAVEREARQWKQPRVRREHNVYATERSVLATVDGEVELPSDGSRNKTDERVQADGTDGTHGTSRSTSREENILTRCVRARDCSMGRRADLSLKVGWISCEEPRWLGCSHGHCFTRW